MERVRPALRERRAARPPAILTRPPVVASIHPVEPVLRALARGRHVEKVEKVLAAEESAARILADAREHAASIRAAAEVEARATVADAASEAELVADKERAAVVARASADAAALEDRAARDLGERTAAARARLDGAAATLAGILKG
jgi:vacuolar-type H+-ATPase subunit H